MRLINSLFLLSLLSIAVSCNDDEPTIKLESSANEFVWKGLNSWYYWQENVADLSDGRFEKTDDLYTFLNRHDSPEELFQELKYTYDRFSWIVDDYEALDNFFEGTTKSFGYEYGLVSWTGDSIIGYVRYVVPSSPADQAGLQRGDIIHSVDGQRMIESNLSQLLSNKTSYSLGLGRIVNGDLIAKEDPIALDAIDLTENPVHVTRIIETEGKKIGYLNYNGFTHPFHSELNAAFSQLAGVDELVLDLRYNSGGSILTAMHLASMIYGDASASDVFGKIVFNKKHGGNQLELPFVGYVDVVDGDYKTISTEPLNELQVDRVYVLMSERTASASELVIAGLLPYMDVILIGTQTVGKNQGSRTLYDSPATDFTDKASASPSHTYAMQPIVSVLANSEDFSDYTAGFLPDIEIHETQFMDRLLPLGDPNEPLLETAIAHITGKQLPGRRESISRKVHATPSGHPFEMDMHINGIE